MKERGTKGERLKILHFADLHLGVETYGHINPETGLSTRLEDSLKALDRLVDYALENRVDLVLFCGDAYKTREPSQTQQREFARRISRLSSGNVPVFNTWIPAVWSPLKGVTALLQPAALASFGELNQTPR